MTPHAIISFPVMTPQHHLTPNATSDAEFFFFFLYLIPPKIANLCPLELQEDPK